MQLPMLPTVSVYFGVFSVVSPLPASQEPKGKESPFSRAALTEGFCSDIAEGFIWLPYRHSEMLNFSGSSLLETFQDSSQPLPTQPFPTFPLLESRHSCYAIAPVPRRKGNENSQITLVSSSQESQIHFHMAHICMGRSHRFSL